MPTHTLVGTLLIAVPTAYLFWDIYRRQREAGARSRSPFSEKMLRPAGESLRLKVMEIEDAMLNESMAVVFLMAFPGLVVCLKRASPAVAVLLAECHLAREPFHH